MIPCEPDVASIRDWLIDGARDAPEPGAFLSTLCGRLAEQGVSLWRVGIFVRTLHPNIYGRNYIWRPDQAVTTAFAEYGIEDSPEFLRSPMRPLYYEGREVRFKLDDPASHSYPFFDDVRGEGVTDYFAAPLRFIDGALHGSSWTTRQPDGFTDAQLAALRSLIAPLTRLIESIGLRRRAETLLDTYVGNRAGQRILAGQIRRGHTETMNAAIWLSDLRGFTALSDRLPPEQVVRILNDYFDCQVPAILRYGGEVLKFMGDGLLAVFPISDGDAQGGVADRVMLAAREAREAVAALIDSNGEHYRFGVALHIGQVLYGNIGGGNRLDFTCIGPAVNLAARLEKIASRLGRTVVASEVFASASADIWRDLGEFPIAGFSAPSRVFGLPDED